MLYRIEFCGLLHVCSCVFFVLFYMYKIYVATCSVTGSGVTQVLHTFWCTYFLCYQELPNIFFSLTRRITYSQCVKSETSEPKIKKNIYFNQSYSTTSASRQQTTWWDDHSSSFKQQWDWRDHPMQWPKPSSGLSLTCPAVSWWPLGELGLPELDGFPPSWPQHQSACWLKAWWKSTGTCDENYFL